ncbi:MAG TPA: universal stress protein [Methanocella sp.]|nr:universal stress protein [Methanocella sp.]
MIPEYRRPDPDELLKLITAEEARENRGKLTIYFGYAPGVGKTYSMLSDARSLWKEGKDAVIGWLQTHGRKETESLAEGMEFAPTLEVEYSGIKLKEMNLPAILERKPAMVVVDELAHTNAPGMKHQKRYQDVEEVLDAGIDVFATLNVQHLESLNDIVAKISGATMRETVPDPIFLSSGEVKLIDLPVDDLLKRLKEGKVYTRDMAREAVHRFFEPYTLLGLRQLATREVSIRLDHRIFRYLKEQGLTGPWYASDRVLVGLHASPYAVQIVRAAFRLSSELNAELIAVHVVSDQDKRFTDEETAWLRKAVDVARDLQVRIVELKGNDISAEIARFANENNVTKILIGKPLRHGNIRPIDRLLSLTSGIDVYIFAGQGKEPIPKMEELTRSPINQLLKYFKG